MARKADSVTTGHVMVQQFEAAASKRPVEYGGNTSVDWACLVCHGHVKQIIVSWHIPHNIAPNTTKWR